MTARVSSLAEYQTLEARLLAALRPDLGEAEFGTLALEVHAFQRRWNEPYAAFCAQRPMPRTWREIPPVPTGAFKRARLSVLPAGMATKVFRTSGTTGETRGEHHFVNTRLYDAAALAGWRRIAREPVIYRIFTPHSEQAPESSLAHMLERIGQETAGSEWWMNGGRLRGDFENLAAPGAQPVALLGTALAFLHVCERLGERRLRLPSGSFAMETGGYKGSGREIPKAELYERFRECLGLALEDVVNEYGMTELSSQFYTRGLGRPHDSGPWVRAVVFDPETGGEVPEGAMGALRIYDLANLGSVLAIETQDLAIRRGSAFELIGRDPAAIPRGCSRAADERLRP